MRRKHTLLTPSAPLFHCAPAHPARARSPSRIVFFFRRASRSSSPRSSAPHPLVPSAAMSSAGTWVEAKDPKSGKSYFYNKTTKVTQWSRPAEMDQQTT